MQVDASLVLGAFATIISGGLGVMLTLVKMNVDSKEKEADRRYSELRSKVEGVDGRLHTEEKATIRQDGDLRLVQTTHTNLTSDVNEIKQTMATKEEVRHIGRTMDKLLERFEANTPRRYTSGQGSYSVADPTKPNPR